MASVFMCPTPKEHCTGGVMATNAALRSSAPKFHRSSDDSYRCHRRYLIKVRRCQDLGNREFRCPDVDGIIFLAKKSKFGRRCRLGKEGGRWMPDNKGGGEIITT